MRILHTSDWHLGKKIEGRDRLLEQRTALEELCSLAQSQDAHAVFVCGDIFDTFLPSAEAEDLFYSAVTELSAGGRRLIVVIAGNHDDPVRLCAAAPLAGRQSIVLSGGGEADYLALKSRNFSPIDSAEGFIEVQHSKGERLVLSLLPYPSDARLKQISGDLPYSLKVASYLDRGQSRFTKDKLNFNLTHLFAAGASPVGEEREIEVGGLKACTLNVFSPLSSYTALGHIHGMQKLTDNICYSGAVLKYSVSDTAKKGVMMIDAHAGSAPEVQFVPLATGRDVVRINAPNAVQGAALAEQTNAYVYLNIVSDTPLLHSEYKQLNALKNVVGITLEGLSGYSAGLNTPQRKELSPGQLFTEYYKSLYGGESPDAALLNLFEELMHKNS